MPRPLWKHYLDLINEHPSTSSPGGQDAPRVKWLFAELYRLGERTTREQVAAHLKTHNHGQPLGHHQKKVLGLWTERLRYPHRRWRGGSGWIYPFFWAEQYVAEYGGDSIATRLARVLARAAADYAAIIDTAPDSDDAEVAAEELRHAHYALAEWGRILDRVGEEWPGGFLPSPIPASHRRTVFTTRGKRRYDEWMEQIRAQWEAQPTYDPWADEDAK
jgi:hypothetical protein